MDISKLTKWLEALASIVAIIVKTIHDCPDDQPKPVQNVGHTG